MHTRTRSIHSWSIGWLVTKYVLGNLKMVSPKQFLHPRARSCLFSPVKCVTQSQRILIKRCFVIYLHQIFCFKLSSYFSAFYVSLLKMQVIAGVYCSRHFDLSEKKSRGVDNDTTLFYSSVSLSHDSLTACTVPGPWSRNWRD